MDEEALKRIALSVADPPDVGSAARVLHQLIDDAERGYQVVAAAVATGLVGPEAERRLREAVLSAYRSASWAVSPVQKMAERAASSISRSGFSDSKFSANGGPEPT